MGLRGGLWQGERGKDRFCNCKVQLMVLKGFLLNTFEFDFNIEWKYKQHRFKFDFWASLYSKFQIEICLSVNEIVHETVE